MIYDIASLKIEYKGYSNINQKISLEVKKGNLIRVKKGIYTNNLEIDAPILANVLISPSYISFEYALSYYGLIPEMVTMYTSAIYNKKNNQYYSVKNTRFDYRSIPNKVFPYGYILKKNEEGINYKIATKEKALMDTLYSKYPIRSLKDLKILLFDDLRIDEYEFNRLDFKFIKEVAPLYHSNTLYTLIRYINKIEKNNRINQ